MHDGCECYSGHFLISRCIQRLKGCLPIAIGQGNSQRGRERCSRELKPPSIRSPAPLSPHEMIYCVRVCGEQPFWPSWAPCCLLILESLAKALTEGLNWRVSLDSVFLWKCQLTRRRGPLASDRRGLKSSPIGLITPQPPTKAERPLCIYGMPPPPIQVHNFCFTR